jgi:hypothetical protein
MRKSIKPATGFLTALIAAVLFLSGAAGAAPQQGEQGGPQPVSPDKEYLGPIADSIRPYRPANRDPFKRNVKPPDKKGQQQKLRNIGFPSLEARRAEFRQKVEMARSRDLAEPDPVQQYLIGELDVTGVFRDDKGFGAFVRAQATGTVFFVRRGSRCYNGEVVSIEGDDSDTGTPKVLFREITYVEVNSKQTQQERMVAKVPTVPQRSRK